MLHNVNSPFVQLSSNTFVLVLPRMQFTYGTGQQPLRGGSGGTLHTIDLDPDEVIIEISGTYGPVERLGYSVLHGGFNSININ